MEETIDYVDDNDKVIGNGFRSVIKKKRFNYRSVHIFIFNSKNELLICKRPDNKNSYPNLWTSSAGGHVSNDESYEQSAYRELEEELGIKVKLGRRDKIKYSHPKGKLVFIELWIGNCDEGFIFDSREIVDHKFVSINEIKKLIKKQPGDFVPMFVELLEKF